MGCGLADFGGFAGGWVSDWSFGIRFWWWIVVPVWICCLRVCWLIVCCGLPGFVDRQYVASVAGDFVSVLSVAVWIDYVSGGCMVGWYCVVSLLGLCGLDFVVACFLCG